MWPLMLCYSMSSVSAHHATKGTVPPKCLMWADRRANASTVECSGIVIVQFTADVYVALCDLCSQG